MEQSKNLYPINPQGVPASVTEPSSSFKSEVSKVMASVLLFFLVYLLLIAASIVLSVICIYLGIIVIAALTNLLGLVAGLGIISIGILVFVFLIKFIFSVKKFDESGSIEITAAEQPELFAFIGQLTKDTQTHFPKKIILSPEVNACVFYNDSFWSMIFPVKKNLQIGLGLVNTLTLSEFKAVMAHEFGHFSQRSMKLGSFVYNVNKVIYNILYDNKGYAGFLQGWGKLHWAISFFVTITIELLKGIQKILKAMYGLINKSYMSLSREMEFHADAVAASVSGSNNLITALRKVEVSDVCYNAVIGKANEWLKQKSAFQNIYANHHIVMQQYAAEYNLPTENSVPVVNDAFYKSFQQSKINIKNQWASHPSREDREAHLEKLNVPAVTDNRSAWVLFQYPEKLQQSLTQGLYANVNADLKQQTINAEIFREKYVTDIEAYSLPAAYNGYYDSRQMDAIDFEKIAASKVKIDVTKENFETFFSNEKIGLLKSLQVNQSDIQLLEAISKKDADVKTFDYNGEKFEKADAAVIIEKVKKETELQQEQIEKNDEQIALFFYNAALLNGNETAAELKNKYLKHFNNRKQIEEYTNICQYISEQMAPLFRGEQVSLVTAEDMAANLRRKSEEIKPFLKKWNAENMLNENGELIKKLTMFYNAQFQYFNSPSFLDTEIMQLNDLINETVTELTRFQYKQFKLILEYQLHLFKNIAGQ